MSRLARLSPAQMHARLVRLAPHLSTRDRQRLATIESLFDSNGELHLSIVLRAVTPRGPRKKRLAAFKRLRDNLAEAAAVSGESLVLKFDADRPPRNAVDTLQCWFESDVASEKVQQQYAARQALLGAQVAGKERFEDGKQVVTYFVMLSLAPELMPITDDLLKRLQKHFGYTAGFRIVKWSARDIEVGADWHAQIQQAIAECDFGLMLVSPEFLGSSYIQEQELPKFIAPDGSAPVGAKIAVPVALAPFSMDKKRSELRGIEHRQIFFGNARGKPVAYSQCSNPRARDEFALRLYERIMRLIENKFGS